MPFTVITLKNVPPSLRGDLTKWMQEISTGVYVGNFNSRVREYIWKRVCDSAETGEATISYSFRNEIGYNFETLNSGRTVIDCDGIPLVLVPETTTQEKDQNNLKSGFSSAYKMHKAHVASHLSKGGKSTIENEQSPENQYVVLDIETTGLSTTNDDIIEIGAVKFDGKETSFFHELIDIDSKIPDTVVQLTGITNDLLTGAKKLKPVLESLCAFIENLTLVGYNINFDVQFINAALERCGKTCLGNHVIDLLKLVKKEQIFQTNYKLATTLKTYEISDTVPHRALEDAKLIFQLSRKVNVFQKILHEQGRI